MPVASCSREAAPARTPTSRGASPSSATPSARSSRVRCRCSSACRTTRHEGLLVKSLRGTFQSMHVRNFRLFFTGQLISQGGTWMQTIALNWLVLHLSHNNGFLVGLAIALQFLPTLLFGVWGGAIADRFDKRKVLLCTQVAMMAVAVVLAVVDFTGVVQLWMLYALVFTYGMALAVDNPTRQSFVS